MSADGDTVREALRLAARLAADADALPLQARAAIIGAITDVAVALDRLEEAL